MPIWRSLSDALAAMAHSPSVGALLARLGMLRGLSDDPTESIGFTIAIVALSAKIARADGLATGAEFEAFELTIEVPEDERANVRRLFDLAKQDVAGYETYARQIGLMLKDAPALRRDVLQNLFVVAAADGFLHEEEEVHLRRVAEHLRLSPSEYGWVRSLFVADRLTPYQLLGLTPAASLDELKARYRELVRETHPDGLTGRGEPADTIAMAQRRLAAINDAYGTILKERAA
jgi:DnaJ like chaperone protein